MAAVASNQMCTLCNMRPAELYCTCLGASTFLCLDDVGRHYAKLPGVLHQNYPIQTLSYKDIPGYFERLAGRQAALEHGRRELAQNLSNVDLCIREFSEKVEQIMTAVIAARDRTTEKLMQTREKIERKTQEAIAEAENTVFEDEAKLASPLAAVLRSRSAVGYSLFTYRLTELNLEQTVERLLEFTHKEVPGSDAPPRANAAPAGAEIAPKLPNLSSSHLRFLNFTTKVWQAPVPLLQSIVCDEGSVYALIHSAKVFCCGARSADRYSQHAYVLGQSGEVDQLQHMSRRRSYAGVIFVDDCVYVFGGVDRQGLMTAGERVRIRASRVWEDLPDLHHARGKFTPCCWRELIYLCGGCPRGSIEAFSPSAFTGMRLAVLLPGEMNSATAVWTAGEQLCVLTKTHYSQYRKIDGTVELELVSTATHRNNWEPVLNCIPVVVEGVVFMIKEEECSRCLVTNGVLSGYT